MACFIVPATEAVVTTILAKVIDSRGKGHNKTGSAIVENGIETRTKISFRKKLSWLTDMLWGGSALLAFEHIWHGEVTPWFPFLTAASDPVATSDMLKEMATAGVSMAMLVTAVWGVMVAVSNIIEKRISNSARIVADGVHV